jgi:hypothetical protein
VTVVNAAGYPEEVSLDLFRAAWYPLNPGNPAARFSNDAYERAWADILDRAGRPASVVSPGLSIELADAPPADTPEARVRGWLMRHKDLILGAERDHGVDRRAVAGAIAWEALKNVHYSFYQPMGRFSGPGKVHFAEHWYSEGTPVSKEVEDRGMLPKRTMEERRTVLGTPSGAITYIGTIMQAFADEARRAGYEISFDAPMLATFFNVWNLSGARAMFAAKKPGEPLAGNPLMGAWVRDNLAFLESIVGKPSFSTCPGGLSAPSASPRK